MIELRCSNSLVRLKSGQEFYCENTVEDIKKQLSLTGAVNLDLSDYNTELPVAESFIADYCASD